MSDDAAVAALTASVAAMGASWGDEAAARAAPAGAPAVSAAPAVGGAGAGSVPAAAAEVTAATDDDDGIDQISPEEQNEFEQTQRFRAATLLASDADFTVDTEAPQFKALPSADSFAAVGLNAAVLANVATIGWTNPSGVQKKTLPALTHPEKPNVLVQARGGSGKTGAFGLASLHNIDASKPGVQAVIISPTNLLADNIVKVMTALAAGTGITVAQLEGGAKAAPKGHILVGTAGGFANAIDKERLTARGLSGMRLMVVDEADELITRSPKELAKVHAELAKAAGGTGKLQVLLFSASFEFLKPASAEAGAGDAKKFATTLLGNGARPRVNFIEPPTAPNSTFFALETGESLPAKVDELVRLFEDGGAKKTLVFVQSGKRVQAILEELERRGKTYARGLRFFRQRTASPAEAKEAGRKAADARKATVEAFSRGDFKLLIATDAMGRGIDIAELKLMVNFDLPRTWDPVAKRFVEKPEVTTFQHRCARVGRGLNYGASVSFVANAHDLHLLKLLAAHFHQFIFQLPDAATSAANPKVRRLFARFIDKACSSTFSFAANTVPEGLPTYIDPTTAVPAADVAKRAEFDAAMKAAMAKGSGK